MLADDIDTGTLCLGLDGSNVGSRLAEHRVFLALLALILANQIGFGLITPVLPSYAKSFGLGPAELGLVIAIYGFARFLANVPAGQLAERRGRRPVLIAGTAITSVASALIATAGSLPQLLAYRLLAGLGAATVLTGGQIMVGDISSPENRGRMMSTYQGVFLVGVALGPLPGGLLADRWGLRAPFVAYAVFSALACVFAMWLIRETRPTSTAAHIASSTPQGIEAHDATPEDASVTSVVRSAAFLLIGFVTFSQFFARTGAIFAIIPLLGQDRFGMSAAEIGFAQTLVTVLNLATVYLSGSLADRYGRKVVIAPATIVSGVALLLWAWAPSTSMYYLCAVIWGFGAGLSGPAPAAYIADLAPTSIRAQVYGYWRSVSDCGYIVGPILMGFLAEHTGYAVPLVLTGTIIGASGTAFWLFAPEFHRRTAAYELPRAGSRA